MKRFIVFPLLFILLVGPSVLQVNSTWWYFSQFDSENLRLSCEHLPNLSKKQRQICGRNADLVKLIGDGIRNGIAECQHQFRFQKWNCSTFSNDFTLFGKHLVRGGTREVGFLQAMHSASAIYSLAKACSKGHPKCGCSSEIPNGEVTNTTKYDGQFKWDGCDNVVKFSTNFVRKFIDAAESRVSDGKAKFTLHNNRVGRIIVRRSMGKVCKCHGLSGSCSMKTCWKTLPTIRRIGDSLRDKYDAAVEITWKPSGVMIPQQGHHHQPKPTKHNLVFYERSPDFCRVNVAHGSLGTYNRLCHNTDDGEESCDILCCRQKYEITKFRHLHHCNCTFTWCCEVSCRICNSTKTEYRCK